MHQECAITDQAPGTIDNGKILQDVRPEQAHRVHLLGVAGTGMGSFAGMLKAVGHVVTGSDQNVYPPMSDMLAAWGIEVMTPYAPGNLDQARPDLVVVGNVIRRVNPEATAVRERRLPAMSFPAAFGALFLRGRHPVVVVGTHGKTTTSALVAHLLVTARLDPSFLVGGVTGNAGSNFRVGKGPHVVVEGDEYDTAYFDKGPKFLHYQPRTAIFTSMELDHADIYRDEAHYASAFERFVALVPADGLIAVSAGWPAAVALCRAGRARVVTYTVNPELPADVQAQDVTHHPDGVRFTLVDHGRRLGPVHLAVPGLHNVENALGGWAAIAPLGVTFEAFAAGCASFLGVKRRQEVRGEVNGILVVDDFAHHPTAVRETIHALRARWPDRRLWAVFEPRSNTSRRKLHQVAYAGSFDGAARVSLKAPEKHDQVPEGEELDIPRLVADLRAHGLEADAASDVPTLVARVATEARPGDVILGMSNGSFGGFHAALLAALRERRP
ncbi:MAG TPA: Mur ligase family protein [Myxococcaceae bacterium]|nr:Mur ligase family protein [Myxococcaceae bacterium]